MNYEVPNMRLIPQDKTMSCWYAAGQMIIKWRRRSLRMTELAHPDPSQVKRWKKLYNDNTGITNAKIIAFARDLGLRAVPPLSPTPGLILSWLKTYGPLWVNGKRHITVIAGIKKVKEKYKVLVFDPALSSMPLGEWRGLEDWYINDNHSGRDTSGGVRTVFLYAP